MKAIIEICCGIAHGKQRIRVESNRGKLLGWIQPTHVDWSPQLGLTTVYIVQHCHDSNYRTHIGVTLAEAFAKLGISSTELDNSQLPNGVYDEFKKHVL